MMKRNHIGDKRSPYWTLVYARFFYLAMEGGGRCGPKHRNPLLPVPPETQKCHDIQQITPINCIKSFQDIKFEEECWIFLCMQVFDYLLNENTIVVDATLFNKAILIIRDEFPQFWFESVCHELGYDFTK
jgi:hypothetical protein